MRFQYFVQLVLCVFGATNLKTCVAACKCEDGYFEEELTFCSTVYTFSGSINLPQRALKGSLQTVKDSSGNDMSFEIKKASGSDEFIVCKICLQTKKIEKIDITVSGIPFVTSGLDKDGNPFISSGQGTSVHSKTINETTSFTKTCWEDQGGSVRVRLDLHPVSQSRAVVKNIFMKSCAKEGDKK